MGAIAVFDEYKGCFRELDESNFDDDIVVGTIFFSRNALNVINKYFRIVGYVLSDGKGVVYPIDIRKTDVAMLEGTYNCLPDKLKKELIPFNIQVKPPFIWSAFFFRWQFLCDWNVFENNGSFIELASIIIGNENLMRKIHTEKIDFIFPSNYIELSSMARGVNRLFDIDIYNKDYSEDANYLFDSLINEYHINMTEDDVEKHCYYICNLVIEKYKGRECIIQE